MCNPKRRVVARELLDQLGDLAVVREPPELVLGEDRLAVDHDVEDAAATADQLGVDAVELFELLCQTGSSGVVVSGAAVGDLDFHAFPFRWVDSR